MGLVLKRLFVAFFSLVEIEKHFSRFGGVRCFGVDSCGGGWAVRFAWRRSPDSLF